MTSITDSTTPTEGVIEIIGPSGRPIEARVKAFGSGKTLCFLHGLVGLNDHWEDSALALSEKRRCVLFELPLLSLRGDDCSISGVTDLTAKFLRDHIDGPATLVGNSFGGHVALRLALDHAELVDSLVLAGSSGLIEKTMVKGAQIRPSREWLAEKLEELFYDKAHVREADLDRAHAELSVRGGARAMVRLSRSARHDHLGGRVKDITCPALLVWGKQDVVTPPEAARQFMQSLPDARIMWLDECGHAPMMEWPGKFSQAMIDFMDELDARPSAGN
ncbi:MAG: alpha/beta hydrolase [Phycisphaerales bacterium]|nr:alpha/beta hydrolase [Phycisphaerales bacterium]MCB9835568.1 alpha/beta hydrolase [Phycisphaera sp.]